MRNAFWLSFVFRVAVVLVVLLLVRPAVSADAQNGPDCIGYDEAVSALATKLGQHPAHRGLIEGQAMLEIFANSVTGTWTLVVVTVDRQLCPIASGYNWRDVTPEPTGPRA